MSRKAKIFSVIIIALLVFAAIGLYSLPYITLYQIKQAVEQNDSAKLAGYVDFTSVRQDLKEQMKVFLAARMEVIRKSSPMFEILGMELAARLADNMVERVIDSVVTPAGLEELMRGRIVFGQIVRENKKAEGGQSEHSASPPEVSLKYASGSEFVAEIINPSDHNKKVRLILTRRGLEWKLTAVKLPLDSIPWPNLQ